MRPTYLLLALALITGALVHSAESVAQPAGAAKPSPGEEAQRLYQQGNDAYKKGDVHAAEEAYLKAWALAKTFDVAANLGLVELELKKYRDAADYLAFSLRNAPPSSKPAQRESTRTSLEDAKKHIVTVRLTTNVPGARVSVDGQPVAAEMSAAELYVTPGKHVVEATDTQHQPAQGTIEGAAGAALDLTLELKEKVDVPPVPSAVPTASVSSSASAPTTRSAVPAFVLGGGALVAVGFGIGLNVMAADGDASAKRTAQEIRSSKGSCVANAGNFDARCTELASQARGAQTLSGVSVGLLAGAAVVAGGAVLYWFFPGAAPVKVGVVVAPDGEGAAGAIRVRGQF